MQIPDFGITGDEIPQKFCEEFKEFDTIDGIAERVFICSEEFDFPIKCTVRMGQEFPAETRDFGEILVGELAIVNRD